MSILLTEKAGLVEKNGVGADDNQPLRPDDRLSLGDNSSCKVVLATKLEPGQFLLLPKRPQPAGGLEHLEVYLQQPAVEFSSKDGAPVVTAHFPPNACLSSSCGAGGRIDQYEVLSPEGSLTFSTALVSQPPEAAA
jgi:hypothetical protein